MKSQNTKSTDELKREVQSQLSRVEADLNSIQDRLTPGQMIDDAIFYRQGKSLRGTIDHLKNNPVGTAFLSLGTILLMEDNDHHTMEWNARERARSVKQNLSDVKTAIKDQIPNVKESVRSKVQDMRTKAHDISSEMQTKVSEVRDDVENRFGLSEPVNATTEESNFSFTTEDTKTDLKGRAKDMLSSAKGRVDEFYAGGKQRVQNLDPLSYMALGAGLGALTGAALPLTEKETSLVQGKFDDKLGNLGTDLENAINECSNILKDLVIQDVKDYQLRLFR